MALLFASVHQGAVVLSQYATPGFSVTADFEAACRDLVGSSGGGGGGKRSVKLDGLKFHLLPAGKQTFLCVTELQGRQMKAPFVFLQELRDHFAREFDADCTEFAALGAYVAHLVAAYNRDAEPISGGGSGSADARLASLREGLAGVQRSMEENLHSAMGRGEAMGALADCTADLTAASDAFRSQSRELRQTMYWSSIKSNIAIACAVVLVLAGLAWRFGLLPGV